MHAQNASSGPVRRLDDQVRPFLLAQCPIRPQAVPHEDTVAAPALGRVDAADDLGVEDEPSGEREVAGQVSVLTLSGDPTDRETRRCSPLNRLDELRGRFDEVVGEAEVPGQHVGGSAGEDGQDGVGRVSAGEESVDDLVDRPVPAERDDRLGPRFDGFAREGGGMSTGVRRHEFEIERGLECTLRDAQGAGCAASRLGVLDQDGVHTASLPAARQPASGRAAATRRTPCCAP